MWLSLVTGGYLLQLLFRSHFLRFTPGGSGLALRLTTGILSGGEVEVVVLLVPPPARHRLQRKCDHWPIYPECDREKNTSQSSRNFSIYPMRVTNLHD